MTDDPTTVRPWDATKISHEGDEACLQGLKVPHLEVTAWLVQPVKHAPTGELFAIRLHNGVARRRPWKDLNEALYGHVIDRTRLELPIDGFSTVDPCLRPFSTAALPLSTT
ncbi:hypothetical protein J1614_003446 [Plenodomus biglobosus]|nr:hypothetical protein J1614_003446 [Plenodomus biglobosus]